MEFERTTSTSQPNGVNSGIASTDLISTVMNEVRLVTNQTKTRAVAGIGFYRGTRSRLGAWLALGVWIDGTKEVGTRSL